MESHLGLLKIHVGVVFFIELMNIFVIPGKRLQVDLFIDLKTIFVFILPEAGEKTNPT